VLVMTVSEIASKVLAHQIEGLMLHEQMAEYYRFLGLENYAEMHDWHYSEENARFKFIRDYYIHHYNMLPPRFTTHNPNLIPDGWYRYNRDDVDNSTKKNAVKNGLNAWREWEEDTKKMYQQLYTELIKIEEIAFACNVKSLILDVDQELADAMTYCLKHNSIDYDIE